MNGLVASAAIEVLIFQAMLFGPERDGRIVRFSQARAKAQCRSTVRGARITGLNNAEQLGDVGHGCEGSFVDRGKRECMRKAPPSVRGIGMGLCTLAGRLRRCDRGRRQPYAERLVARLSASVGNRRLRPPRLCDLACFNPLIKDLGFYEEPLDKHRSTPLRWQRATVPAARIHPD